MVVVTLSFTISCRSKKVTESKTVEIKKDSIKEDTKVSTVVEISKAVKDSSARYLPDLETGQGKDCDSSCNTKYRNALKSLNFYKKSGENSYKMFYDEKTQLLYTIAQMQETINSKTDSISKLQNFKTSTKEIQTVQTIPVYPRWLVVLAVIGVLSLIFFAYRFSLIFKP